MARDLPDAMGRLGVRTAYGLLTTSAWPPLLAAYNDNPGPAVTTLVGVVGGVGSNLAANLVQGSYDRATAPQRVEQEIAEQPDLRAEYQPGQGSQRAFHAQRSCGPGSGRRRHRRCRDL